MPFRKVPFGIGVRQTPSFTNMTFCAVSSATLPSGSHITALSKPRSLRLGDGQAGQRIQARRLGVGRRLLGAGPPVGRQARREALGRVGQAHLGDDERELGRRRVGQHHPALGPEHRADVERRVGRELRDALAGQRLDLLGGDRRPHVQTPRRADRPLAVQVEIGSHAFERPGAVEDGVGEPGGVGVRGHQRHRAGAPLAVEVADGRDGGVGHARTSAKG